MQNQARLTARGRVCPQSIILLGDSITGQNAGGPSALDEAGCPSNSQGYFNWANFYLGQRFKRVANKGVGGQRTDEMLARFDADIKAIPSGWVCILAGANDVGQGVAAATIIANLAELVRRVRGLGRKVLLLTITPSTSYDTQAKRDTIAAANDWIRLQSSRDVVVVDAWACYANADHTPKAGYVYDATHMSPFGGQAVGKAIADKLSGRTRPRALLDVLGRSSFSEIITHDGFQSAAGWNASGMALVSCAGGVMTTHLAAWPGWNDPGVYRDWSRATGPFARGDVIQASVYAKWSNVVAHSQAQMSHGPLLKLFQRNEDSGAYAYHYGLASEGFAAMPIVPGLLPPNGEGLLLTPRYTVGPAVEWLYVTLGWEGADSGDFEYRDLHVWKE